MADEEKALPKPPADLLGRFIRVETGGVAYVATPNVKGQLVWRGPYRLEPAAYADTWGDLPPVRAGEFQEEPDVDALRDWLIKEEAAAELSRPQG